MVGGRMQVGYQPCFLMYVQYSIDVIVHMMKNDKTTLTLLPSRTLYEFATGSTKFCLVLIYVLCKREKLLYFFFWDKIPPPHFIVS